MKRTSAVLTTVAAGLLLAGCSNQTVRDLEDVPVRDPDKVEIIVNVDGFPNITRLCIDGVAFATTTRDASAAAAFRVPEWDTAWCGAPAS